MSVHSRLEIKSGVDSLQCVKFLTSACLLLVMLGTSVSAQVQSDGTIDWNRYYSNGESNVIMAEWVKQYPTLVKLETIGKSFLGTDLTLVEITNQETGPASEKPVPRDDRRRPSRAPANSRRCLCNLGRMSPSRPLIAECFRRRSAKDSFRVVLRSSSSRTSAGTTLAGSARGRRFRAVRFISTRNRSRSRSRVNLDASTETALARPAIGSSAAATGVVPIQRATSTAAFIAALP